MSLNNKYILFFLCFLLLFNFCLRPYNVEAVVPEVIGGKLLTFLLAMAAAGVTLSVSGKTDSQLALEANKLLQEFEKVSGVIQSWQDMLLDYLINVGYQGVNSFTSLLDSIKNWLQSIDVVQGSNVFYDLLPIQGYMNDYSYELTSYTLNSVFKVCISINNSGRYTILTFDNPDFIYSVDSFNLISISYRDDESVNVKFDLVIRLLSLSDGIVSYNDFLGYLRSVGCYHSVCPENPFEEKESINYNVNADSYVLTGVPPNYYHKPNVLPPPVPTTTWDLTTGRSITTWPGTAEDFADGFADTVTWDDYRDVVAGVPSVPYSFDETVPGTLTIDYDYDYEDEGAGAIPIPYPDIYEGDIPSEGLLQGITNWITSLINTILGIPAKLIALLKELLITLFVPEPDFVQNKAIDINSKIGDKIGDNDYMNFLDSLKTLQGEPIPDGYLYGYKVFDASHINDMAESLKNWQRWFWYILIVLWYMNNVYKMIRGSNMVDFKAYDGVKGGGSSGGAKR